MHIMQVYHNNFLFYRQYKLYNTSCFWVFFKDRGRKRNWNLILHLDFNKQAVHDQTPFSRALIDSFTCVVCPEIWIFVRDRKLVVVTTKFDSFHYPALIIGYFHICGSHVLKSRATGSRTCLQPSSFERFLKRIWCM